MFMLGDYNINLLNHYSHNETNEFLETMFANNLHPLISRPTRITARSCTLIDNIFINTCYENIESGLLYTDLSDHFPVYCLIKVKSTGKQRSINRNTKVKRRLITDKRIQDFKVRLLKFDWSAIDMNSEANTSNDFFHEDFY